MKATNGDITLEWDEVGSGNPVLLIQGLGYGRWGWDPLVPRLAERHRVISFDNRGIGGSSVPPGPYTAAEMAGDALAVLDAAGVDTAHIVGISLGGMIAQEFALSHPDRVDRLVLIATTPGASLGLPMPEVTVRLFAEAAELDPAEAIRRFVVNALAPDVPAETIDAVVALRTANPPDPVGWAGQAAAGTTYDGGERHGQIASHTLVVAGSEDRVVDPRNAEVLGDAIHDSTVHLIAGGGHLLPWDRPDQLADLILDFLP